MCPAQIAVLEQLTHTQVAAVNPIEQCAQKARLKYGVTVHPVPPVSWCETQD